MQNPELNLLFCDILTGRADGSDFQEESSSSSSQGLNQMGEILRFQPQYLFAFVFRFLLVNGTNLFMLLHFNLRKIRGLHASFFFIILVM